MYKNNEYNRKHHMARPSRRRGKTFWSSLGGFPARHGVGNNIVRVLPLQALSLGSCSGHLW